ncbi:MAG: hypothetical protein ACYC2H_00320 [Thermoplasmatota archaeon]
MELQHNCDAMTTGFGPQASCSDVAGLSATSIIVGVLVLAGLVLVGVLIWRRLRNRGPE